MMWHPDMPEEYRNQIVSGDARELTKRIPDESIDLIFTDPVYDRIEDYEWLGLMGTKKLSQGGDVLVYCAHYHLADTIVAMKKSLDYRWVLIEKNGSKDDSET